MARLLALCSLPRTTQQRGVQANTTANRGIMAKVLPILFGSALVTAFQGEEDSKPDLTGVLDTMTEALEEESERLAR